MGKEHGIGKYLAKIEFITPYLAGYNKEHFSIRVFKKGEIELVVNKFDIWRSIRQLEEFYNKGIIKKQELADVIEAIKNEKNRSVDKSLEYYRIIKKLLEKDKFLGLDFMFPRDGFLDIDLFRALVRGVYYVLKKTGGWEVESIEEIKPSVVVYGLYVMYVSNTKTPVVHETIEPKSIIEVVFKASNTGKNEFESNLGRARKYGFGRARFTIEKIS